MVYSFTSKGLVSLPPVFRRLLLIAIDALLLPLAVWLSFWLRLPHPLHPSLLAAASWLLLAVLLGRVQAERDRARAVDEAAQERNRAAAERERAARREQRQARALRAGALVWLNPTSLNRRFLELVAAELAVSVQP